jgi:hypothetical protein
MKVAYWQCAPKGPIISGGRPHPEIWKLIPANRRSMRSGWARQRCWHYARVLDRDIKSFFD